MITSQDIIDEVRSWIGTPVVRSGSVKGKGCNCLGMMAGAAKNLGREDLWQVFEPYRGLEAPPDRLFMFRALKRHLIKVDKVEPGCLIFSMAKETSHVGLVTRVNPVYVAEALPPRVDEHALMQLFIAAFKIPGVRYG